MADLRTNFVGIRSPNPFWLASAPPTEAPKAAEAAHCAGDQGKYWELHDRMFANQAPRPLLLAGSRPDSLTHAYTSMKLLSQRLGALAYDLVVAGDVSPRRARRMGDRLADCADHFLGAALRQVAVVDPLVPAQAPVAPELRGLVADLMAPATAGPAANPLAALAAPAPQRAPARRSASAGRMN